MFCSVNYSDVIISAMVSQITGVSIVYSTVCSGAGEIKHQSSALLAFVRGIHLSSVNSPHKRPITRKMFPFGDFIMECVIMLQDGCRIWDQSHGIDHNIWGRVCPTARKHIWRLETSNYTPNYLRGVITCPYPWYLILAQRSSYAAQLVFTDNAVLMIMIDLTRVSEYV